MVADWIQIVGYVGSFLIAVSLMMNSIHRLRWVNLFGAATFATYGLLVHALPVFILNSFISLVDVYYLVQIHRHRDYFELLEINNKQSAFLLRFLDFHRADIKKFFPDFTYPPAKEFRIIFILRNLLPVGLFIVEPLNERECRIHLDYVIPSYRDLQTAHYLFHTEHQLFASHHKKVFITHSTIPRHQKYLNQLGFRKDAARGDGWYVKEI